FHRPGRTRGLADPSAVGGHGARHHGLGSGPAVDRPCALSVTGIACQRDGERVTLSFAKCPSRWPLRVDAVEKVSEIELWNWILKLSNRGSRFFESRLRKCAWT